MDSRHLHRVRLPGPAARGIRPAGERGAQGTAQLDGDCADARGHHAHHIRRSAIRPANAVCRRMGIRAFTIRILDTPGAAERPLNPVWRAASFYCIYGPVSRNSEQFGTSRHGKDEVVQVRCRVLMSLLWLEHYKRGSRPLYRAAKYRRRWELAAAPA